MDGYYASLGREGHPEQIELQPSPMWDRIFASKCEDGDEDIFECIEIETKRAATKAA